ncbi:TPA: DUF551 domain-containing protein [Escherichia coli]|uniref:DUF551 domain-containing protein n=1 Tax=Escherichia coli TaxID=562 RepID=UPI0015978FB6|nr:DUF551 domain-containing protein [Escherichia coli]QKQ00509.1 DUF551 domain-containing protein [Escherichia coli]HAL9836312.1 DUF551 domain-containing protein [Escherichia coli]HAX8377619.1 DUF551 domain-containing protein [Escherichia coli]HBA4285971.1 DUF551 domain-containing protein [Escherichia coli]
MTTITKERIELFIKNPLENGLTRGEQMELARIALASLEADPVKRVNSDQMRRVCLEANRHLDKYDAMAKEVNKLLGRIAPPAPVVPEEISTTHTMLPAMSDQLMAFGYVKGWNACRAAMLHAGNFRKNANSSTNNFRDIEETSTNSPVTPDSWISCSERMPNEEDVLVYCSDTKEQMVGFHKGKGLFQFFYMNGVEGVCEPSHWMPLPEPPL